MHILRLIRTRIDDRERGIAMVMVIGMTVLLSGLVVAGIAYGTGAARQSQRDQNWSSALAAAYAGIEEYESRLANDLGYFAYGNPAAPFSATSAARLTLPSGASANPAFGLGPSGTWANVAGSAGAAQFRYEVDSSRFYIDGTLRLRSTGRAGGETRTIVADIKQKGFIDFLYFTDYEVMDPQALNPTSTADCAIHYYDAASRSHCSTIFFGGADVINGPLHTNDALQTNGPARFNGKVTTAYKAASGANYVRSGGTAPTFYIAGDPQSIATIGMPATNSQIKKETRSDLPAEVPVTGCLYTGPTKITFHDNGQMTVISPWTKATNTTGTSDTTGTAPAKCGTPGASGLAAKTGSVFTGQRINIPQNLVVYVQNVPSVAGNVNTTSGSTTPTGSVTCPSGGNAIGYPMTDETAPFSGAYGCRNGDVFVQGTLKGNMTIASENYIYVTGDIRYSNSGEDMLGLVGNNAVWVYNPMRVTTSWSTTTYTALLSGSNRRIDAAILSVAHTFMVQNYNRGSARGTLTVNGAIGQKFRGPVGTGSGASMTTGYGKDYNYDERFRYTAPPKFLSPVTTTYGVSVWIEVEPAFRPDGSVS
ncbi:hypothetical protein Cph01nite_15770 [Cellulomonas phragmiteti]|uniref:Type 4 fimbrial biogenesis protein PilX N-terminal domain-containing protein n=2 Tax=Cellulomonas phragmiteti TaxID=478780 RepID=A0ABQ4DKG0_9CELL|nr:hypothetical protein Cph01nite_15770 [Cellulomonas phragmiteti]